MFTFDDLEMVGNNLEVETSQIVTESILFQYADADDDYAMEAEASKKKTSNLWGKVMAFLRACKDALKNAWEWVKNKIKNILKNIKDFLRSGKDKGNDNTTEDRIVPSSSNTSLLPAPERKSIGSGSTSTQKQISSGNSSTQKQIGTKSNQEKLNSAPEVKKIGTKSEQSRLNSAPDRKLLGSGSEYFAEYKESIINTKEAMKKSQETADVIYKMTSKIIEMENEKKRGPLLLGEGKEKEVETEIRDSDAIDPSKYFNEASEAIETLKGFEENYEVVATSIISRMDQKIASMAIEELKAVANGFKGNVDKLKKCYDNIETGLNAAKQADHVDMINHYQRALTLISKAMKINMTIINKIMRKYNKVSQNA